MKYSNIYIEDAAKAIRDNSERKPIVIGAALKLTQDDKLVKKELGISWTEITKAQSAYQVRVLDKVRELDKADGLI